MGVRGRKSGADLSVVPTTGIRLHLPPPMNMTDDERKLWLDTVMSRPVDWFRPEHVPMLKEYVRSVTQSDKLAKRIEKTKDVDELVKLQRAAGMVTKNILTLARSMRLTHQSLYARPEQASTAANKFKSISGGPAKRPWEA